MSVTKKGWQTQRMMSLFKKEATFGAGVVMSDAHACSMRGFDGQAAWDDKVENDKGDFTGREHGFDQELITQGVKIPHKEARCKPNSLVGICGLVMGSITSAQDGALAAYSHKIVPVTVGTALPSITVEEKVGDLQYRYVGVKGNSFKLSGAAGECLALDAELIGSGARETSTTAMAAAIVESWLKLSNCKVWLEDGSDISIAASLTQDAENISGATPAALHTRMKSFEVGFANELEGQLGFGGAGVFQDLDYKRRKVDLKFSLQFNDGAELAHFVAQNPLAIEFDLKGALIAATGAMYYGVQIIVPRFKLKAAPLPKGGVNDVLTADFDCEVFEDGTNQALIIQAYNAQAAYLAAP